MNIKEAFTANEHAQEGMSLRDYLAAHTTEQDIAKHKLYCSEEGGIIHRTREQAKYAYADAMLEVRKGETK